MAKISVTTKRSVSAIENEFNRTYKTIELSINAESNSVKDNSSYQTALNDLCNVILPGSAGKVKKEFFISEYDTASEIKHKFSQIGIDGYRVKFGFKSKYDSLPGLWFHEYSSLYENEQKALEAYERQQEIEAEDKAREQREKAEAKAREQREKAEAKAREKEDKASIKAALKLQKDGRYKPTRRVALDFLLDENIPYAKIDVSLITDMYGLFYEDYAYENKKGHQLDYNDLDGLKDWDVSNVTCMVQMFEGCTSFTGECLANWNVSNVSYMENILRGHNSL